MSDNTFQSKFGEAQERASRKRNSHKKTNGESGTAYSLASRCAAEIAPEPIEWLWPGRLACGKHTCIAGEPGTGKSQLTIAVVAAVTTGGPWPCGEGQAPLGNVIILSAEDGAADTIVPRLVAAGADRGLVQIVSAVRNSNGSRRAVNLPGEINRMAREHGLTAKAIRSARETLEVKINRDGFGPGSKSWTPLPLSAKAATHSAMTRPATIPADSWPLDMRAETATAYCDEHGVDASLRKVQRGIEGRAR